MRGGIGKGQGEFTQQYVADGGQQPGVNYLKGGKQAVWWQKDNSEWIQFANLARPLHISHVKDLGEKLHSI